jgi:membrane protein implicated in regulation of membrane protease activity
MNSTKMPGWLVVLLSVLGVAILGPPALVLIFLVLGVALSVGVALLKVSLVALGVAAVVFVVRAMFGNRTPARLPSSSGESIELIAARLEAEEAERRHELDRQLAEMQSARTSTT